MIKSFCHYEYQPKDGFPAHWFMTGIVENGGTMALVKVIAPGEVIEISLLRHSDADRSPHVPTLTRALLPYADFLTTLKDADEQKRILVREFWHDSPTKFTVGEMVMMVTEPIGSDEPYVVLADRCWCRKSLNDAIQMGIAFPSSVARGWFQTSSLLPDDQGSVS
ncbi:MAG TPA: hypothetical protein VGK74_11580 [Symbiobacteriaceae bacterium]|jgi:hypothetical protein